MLIKPSHQEKNTVFTEFTSLTMKTISLKTRLEWLKYIECIDSPTPASTLIYQVKVFRIQVKLPKPSKFYMTQYRRAIAGKKDEFRCVMPLAIS